ncbi:hypothetical Protein YC6258_02829 [Gynuella sunshinyii YC6258]|uniref:Uncharacterized protein n=1 Tax=Gynuella sunshinyii YC6258 TaxID=1445510 RepID=A0A0C5VJN3_9GAMM|nr:hypothetical Protein YC6258_02829 [Gynuella sunshinyii YC6258]
MIYNKKLKLLIIVRGTALPRSIFLLTKLWQQHNRTPILTIDIHANSRHYPILYIYQYKDV